MDWFSKTFIKASLTWLALGVTLGVAMAIHTPWLVYRPAHLHMNLLGFVAMMIFGVAYHVMPRIVGRALHSSRLAVAHWWLANVGLSAMVAGFGARPHAATAGALLLGAGGVLAALGAYAFVYNLWRTLDGAPASVARRTPGAPPRRRLPVAGDAA
jgi:cbb3-type cytochrome oxidase subunit 1